MAVEVRLLVLPDCRARATAHALSSAQRRAIVRLLASEGKDALEAWLKEEERRDPLIRKRLAEERARLEREARARRRDIESRHDEKRRATETAWEQRMREHAEREEAMRGRLSRARSGPGLSMDDLVAASPLFRAAAGRERPRGVMAWLRWFGAWVASVFVGLWVRLVRAVRRLFGWKPPARRVVRLPDGFPVALSGKTGLDPRLVVEVRRRLREGKSFEERVRQWWDRMLGREDYAEAATRLMEEELASRRAAKKLELEAEAADLEARLSELERETQQALRRRGEDEERLREEQQREVEALEEHIRSKPYEDLKAEVLEQLEEAGLVDAEGSPTEALMERFSSLLYDEARRSLPSGGETSPGTYLGGEGEYHKAPIRSLNERGAVELVDSLVRARLEHPRVRRLYDSDLMVHREVRTAKTHVVLIFDQSGSMEMKGRLQAAKTVCLTMYRAIKDIDPLNRVDILAMHTGVEAVTLSQLWSAEPKGFTNHGRALAEAQHLLDQEGADRRLVYLITDGLPEARTVRGVDSADRPEVCMPYAIQEARALGAMEGTRLLIIQLETEDPLYLDAARQIAQAAGGEVEAVEPERLTETLLVDLERMKARERVLLSAV